MHFASWLRAILCNASPWLFWCCIVMNKSYFTEIAQSVGAYRQRNTNLIGMHLYISGYWPAKLLNKKFLFVSLKLLKITQIYFFCLIYWRILKKNIYFEYWKNIKEKLSFNSEYNSKKSIYNNYFMYIFFLFFKNIICIIVSTIILVLNIWRKWRFNISCVDKKVS